MGIPDAGRTHFNEVNQSSYYPVSSEEELYCAAPPEEEPYCTDPRVEESPETEQPIEVASQPNSERSMYNQKMATCTMNVTGGQITDESEEYTPEQNVSEHNTPEHQETEHGDPVTEAGHYAHKTKYGATAVEGAAEGLEHGAHDLSKLRSETFRATGKGEKWTPRMKKLDHFSRSHNLYKSDFNRLASTSGKAVKVAGKAVVALKVVDAGFQVYERKTDDGKFTGKDAAAVGGSLAGGIAGGIAGAKGGALLGAAIGSIFPGAGTLIGGAIGGAIGGIAGAIVGSMAGEKGGEYIGDKTGLKDKTVF